MNFQILRLLCSSVFQRFLYSQLFLALCSCCCQSTDVPQKSLASGDSAAHTSVQPSNGLQLLGFEFIASSKSGWLLATAREGRSRLWLLNQIRCKSFFWRW